MMYLNFNYKATIDYIIFQTISNKQCHNQPVSPRWQAVTLWPGGRLFELAPAEAPSKTPQGEGSFGKIRAI